MAISLPVKGKPSPSPVFLFSSRPPDTATQNTSSQRTCGHLSPHQRTALSSVVIVEVEGFPPHHQAKLRTLAGVPTI